MRSILVLCHLHMGSTYPTLHNLSLNPWRERPANKDSALECPPNSKTAEGDGRGWGMETRALPPMVLAEQALNGPVLTRWIIGRLSCSMTLLVGVSNEVPCEGYTLILVFLQHNADLKTLAYRGPFRILSDPFFVLEVLKLSHYWVAFTELAGSTPNAYWR